MGAEASLRAVKIAHTAVWAAFVACIAGVPLAAWAGRYRLALVFGVAVLGEVLVLAWNGWRCPLTGVAARYTDDRRPNFDIYLPAWLARYNKEIFGPLYVAGVVVALLLWWLRAR